VAGIGLAQVRAHVRRGGREGVLHHPADVVLQRVELEAVPIAETVQLDHLLEDRLHGDELVEGAVGHVEREPTGVAQEPERLPFACAVGVGIERAGDVDAG